MKFSSAFAAAAALAGSASALPLVSRQIVSNSTSAAPATSMVMNASTGFTQGAAYFLTNEPQGNFVVSADIGSDGTIALARAYATAGRGQHGLDGADGPDGMFSQGAVKVSPATNLLAAVNPGSNTVSLFKIDPNTPSLLTQFGLPVSSEGEFPMSLAFNSAGNQVCVLNGGSINGVNCYMVDSTLGLVAMNNSVRSLGLNQTTPATGPAGSASHVIFSEDGKSLVASVKGVPPTPGFFAIWDVASDGTLSQNFTKVNPPTGGLLPFSMTAIPGKNAILATDAGVGVDILDMSNLQPAINGSTNSTGESSILPIQGQGATCWSTFSPQSGNFYVTDIDTSMVTEVGLDANLKPSIVKQYPQGNNSATIDLDAATIGGKDFLYILMPNVTSVQVMAVNGPGQAQNIQTVDISGPAAQVGLTVSKANLQGMTAFIKPS
ncbi:hypothetical protein BV25DRAFT_1830389 [Artomyces pyxidatus]|uniref:Uncharacterized protein n=1 Tax=Artomyces pyxidatus TaxID=48021 RepID=A0ACB8SPP0_9AGAM|nr:hypothetical protein BV25DRAFT_1830389 [Artomyces pyxidatus]